MPIEVIMPRLGAVSEESTLLQWLVKQGDLVAAGQPLFEAESDKATVEIEAAAPGRVSELIAQPGQSIPAGEVIAVLLAPGEESPELIGDIEDLKDPLERQHTIPSSPQPIETTSQRNNRMVISPVARSLARQAGIDISTLAGTGPRGRIVEADVKAAIAKAQETASSNIPIPIESSNGQIDETPPLPPSITGLRRTIAQQMSISVQTTARVTLTTEVNAEALVRLREKLLSTYRDHPELITYDLLLAKLAAAALTKHPQLNATLDASGIHMHTRVNLGIAVDTDRGLMVPVIKNVAERNLIELGNDLHYLLERARISKATPEDLSEGTFTLTNLGMFGVDAFTPIIKPPECAILGIGRIVKKPVEQNNTIVLGYRMVISLSFDHRIVDGAPAARFLQFVSELIEAPELLLFLPDNKD